MKIFINRRYIKERWRHIFELIHIETIIIMEIESSDKVSLLPKRPRGSYHNNFKSINVVTNHFPVNVKDFELIHIFSVHYTPKIPLDNTTLRRRLLEENRERMKDYISKYPLI